MVVEIDARGLPCPRPVIETRNALEKMGEGSLRVIVDSKESCSNVERFARSRGCDVSVEQKENLFYIDILHFQLKFLY